MLFPLLGGAVNKPKGFASQSPGLPALRRLCEGGRATLGAYIQGIVSTPTELRLLKWPFFLALTRLYKAVRAPSHRRNLLKSAPLRSGRLREDQYARAIG